MGISHVKNSSSEEMEDLILLPLGARLKTDFCNNLYLP